MKRDHSMDFVFTLILLCIFAVSILTVLMDGVSSYEAVTDRMENNYNARTGIAYITEKVRHCGEYAEVEIAYLDKKEDSSYKGEKVKALKISQLIESERYATYIYCCDGFLRELFTEEDNMLSAEAGNKIVEMKNFEADMDSERILKIICEMPDGKLSSALLNIEGSLSSHETA